MAMQEKDQGFHAQGAEALRGSFQMTIQKEASEATDLADHSEKVRTVRKDHLARALREEVSVATGHVDHSVKGRTARGDHSARVKKEEASATTVQDVLSVTVRKEEASAETDRAGHSAKALKEGASAATGKADSETPERRVSQRRTSTISVTRTRAESAG